MNTKGIGDDLEDHDCGVPGPTLNAADVGSVEVCFETELFLRPAALQPDPLDVESDLFANVHTGSRPILSIIGLRTMSHCLNSVH